VTYAPAEPVEHLPARARSTAPRTDKPSHNPDFNRKHLLPTCQGNRRCVLGHRLQC
jgi:hypothetical protein